MQTFSCTKVKSTDHSGPSAKPTAGGSDDFKQALAGMIHRELSASGKDSGGSRSDVSGAGGKSSGSPGQPEDKTQDKPAGITGMTDTSLLAGLMALQSSGIPVAGGAGAPAALTAGNTVAGTVSQAVSGSPFLQNGNFFSRLQAMPLTRQTAVVSTTDQSPKQDTAKAMTGSVQDILTSLGASATEMASTTIGVKLTAAIPGNNLPGSDLPSSTAAAPTVSPTPSENPQTVPTGNAERNVPTAQSTGMNFVSVLQDAQSQPNVVPLGGNPAAQSAQAVSSQTAGNQAVAAVQTDISAVSPTIVRDTAKVSASTPTGPVNTIAPVTDSVKPVQIVQNAAKSSAESAKDDDSKQQAQTDSASVVNLYSHKVTAQPVVTDADTAHKVDTADVARQISDACKTAADTGKSEIRIHLSPEELGGINIKIVSQNGALSIQISADSRHTGEMLAQNVGNLNRSMSDNGVSMNKVEILYAQTGSFSSQFGSGSGGQQYHSDSSGSATRWVSATQSPETPESGGIEAIPARDSATGYNRMSIFA